MKHISIRYQFINDSIKTKQIDIEWIESKKQLADILTKTMNTSGFKTIRDIFMY